MFSRLEMHWSLHAIVVRLAVVMMYWMWGTYIWGRWGHCPLGAHTLPLGDISACGFLSALANSAFPMARMLVLSSVGLLACALQAPASSTTLRVQTRLQPQLRSVPATIASFLTASQSGLVSIFRTFEVLHLTSPRRLTPNRVLRELYILDCSDHLVFAHFQPAHLLSTQPLVSFWEAPRAWRGKFAAAADFAATTSKTAEASLETVRLLW